MNELYGEQYYRGHGNHQPGCGVDYANEEFWLIQFGRIAKRIVEDFAPDTVLDMGCAWGHLVSSLRDLGVEAFGVDISSYAIENVRKDIKPFCAVVSATDELPSHFPKKFDLLVTIEVIEHLYEEEGLIAMERICLYSDKILFSSSPEDITEATHFNVQQPEYWVKHFAKLDFFRNVNYTPNYISKDAVLFEKGNNISRVLENYEHKIRLLNLENAILQNNTAKSYNSSIYFDTGEGFNADNVIFVPLTTASFYFKFQLPPGTLALRFDPIEQCSCIVKNIEIFSDSGSVPFENVNGTAVDDYYFFLTDDSQIYITPDKPAKWISVEAQIYPCDELYFPGVVSRIEKLLKDIYIGSENIAQLSDEISQLTKHSNNEKNILEGQIQLMSDKIGEIEHQNNEKSLMLEQLLKQHSDEISQLTEQYKNEISQLTDKIGEIEHQNNEKSLMLEQLLKQHSDEISQLTEQHQSEISQIAEQHSYEISQITEQYSDEISHLTEYTNNEKSIMEGQIQLMSYKSYKMEQLLKQRSDKISEITGQHQNEQAQILEQYHFAIMQRDRFNADLQAISNSTFWRITKPSRVVVGGTKRFLRSFPLTRSMYKVLWSIRRRGIKTTWFVIKSYVKRKSDTHVMIKESFNISDVERHIQERREFDKNIKISVIVPLFNTPREFLNEMIDSVRSQTYKNWELCLADGSDHSAHYIGKICRNYAKKDRRILYKKLKTNKGISGNTNEAMAMATGDYFAMLDHDDIIHSSALYEVMRAICERNADFIYTDETTFDKTPTDAHTPNFKPDYSPDTLRSINYICHLSVYSRMLYEKAGGYDSRFDGSQDYDMILRLTENAENIVHIPRILYFWRAHRESVASSISAKPYVIYAAMLAVSEHIHRIGMPGVVEPISKDASAYRIRYELKEKPLVSIIIPNKDHADDLKKCIESIMISSYKNFEIIIAENNSTEEDILEYYKELESNPKVRIISRHTKFNFSETNNNAAKNAKGEYLILLNNDTQVITPDWIEEMLMFAQRPDVGAVGVKLYYPDNTVQHAGVILGLGGVAGHSHKYFPKGHPGYMQRLQISQNLSAVTAACMMIPKKIYDEVGGLDEEFAVAFNDVDLCMRIRQKGYLVVFTPFAKLYHYESKSRGLEDTPEKQKRFLHEVNLFQSRWEKELKDRDPYYNENLTTVREDFSLAVE